jgi:hypothetical protein
MPSEHLFLISPPGSLEASEMGYINVPKIFEAPPSELIEVQSFEDNTGYVTEPSNFWVSKRHITKKRAAFDLIVPIFPMLLRYAVPCILLEYALYCVEAKENEQLGFYYFMDNTIKARIEDYELYKFYLRKEHWRGKDKPTNWLVKVVANHKKRKHPVFLSIDTELIEGDLPQTKSPEEQLIEAEFEEILPSRIEKICKSVGLSETATNLFLTSFEDTVSIRSTAYEKLSLSTKEYEAARKQIQRKQPLKAIQKAVYNDKRLSDYLLDR